jgi:peptide/nickel transport system substrate-binding protein
LSGFSKQPEQPSIERKQAVNGPDKGVATKGGWAMLRRTRRFVGAAIMAGVLATTSWSAMAAAYKEAPEVAARVSKGELPPVDQRLPAEPFVLKPIESVGHYGGVWRSALKGTLDNAWLRRTVLYEPLLSFSLDWKQVVPNVAKSFTVNDEATEFTFKLREGHKWSDGHPFTAHDVVFAIEDVLKDSSYMGERPPLNWQGMTATALDDETLKITLKAPNSLLLQQLASVYAFDIVRFPKHYCSQYHPKYNPDAETLAQKEGFRGWSNALEQHCAVNINIDTKLPTLTAWRLVAPYDGVNPLVRWERNPYYYKVDPEGQQLPYLDGLEMSQTDNVEDIVLKALNGEIDYSNRHFATLPNKPLFFDGQEKGDFHLISTTDARMNTITLQLNLTHQDPVRRKLFNQLDFRKALSMAIDRQEIIDVVFAAQGEPWQAAPRPESRWHHERLAKQYTEFDPEQANELLDGLGLEMGGDGIRLDEQGRPLRIQLYAPSDMTEFKDVGELVKAYWLEVGIDLDVRSVERNFAYETFRSNKHDMHIWFGDGGLGDALLDPRYYFPFSQESGYAIPWANWFQNPNASGAEEPAPAAKQQMELYRELTRTTDQGEQDALFKQILDIAADQFWLMGVSLPPQGYGIAKNDMHNVPADQPYAYVYPTPGPLGVAQLWKGK